MTHRYGATGSDSAWRHKAARGATAVFVTMLVSLMAFSTDIVSAQAPESAWGLGGQVGAPSGLSVKYYTDGELAYEGILSYDVSDDYWFFNARMLHEQSIPDSPLHYFIGPGAVFVAEDGQPAVGASATLGVNFFEGRFEVFLHLTPHLNLVPDTHGTLGGGIGLHYYLP